MSPSPVWFPDPLESLVVRALNVNHYLILKEYLQEGWLSQGPSRRQKAFLFANLATLHKLAQAWLAQNMIVDFGRASEGMWCPGLSATWSPQDIAAYEQETHRLVCAEIGIRLCLSAVIMALRTAFDCVAGEIYLLLAPHAAERCLRKVSLHDENALLQPWLATEHPMLDEDLRRVRTAHWFEHELNVYRNAWTHRETACLARTHEADPPTYRLLRPDLDIDRAWQLLSHTEMPAPSPMSADFGTEEDAARRMTRYIGETSASINAIWGLMYQAARSRDLANLPVGFDDEP